jgi:AraC family transcriptional regulator of adaptative response/methylated-DNA-[protein]-cysteine methyltransferase
VVLSEPIAAAVAATARAIDDAVDSGSRPPSLGELAAATHVSPGHLRRAFVSAIGLSPHAYSDARRADKLRRELAGGADVSAAISTAGFGSPSRVYERTDDLLGMTPAQARRGAPGETISYTLADTSLGRLVVGATDRGVCLVAFGESDAELAEEISRRFTRANIVRAEGEHRAWVEAVVKLIDAPQGPDSSTSAELPLDVRGTVFQRQVWTALREIEPGHTVTYSQLAAAIGRPTATRAVAAACGANPTAVVVPCHRVIGADGALTGYRWGVERKRVLLDREDATLSRYR